MKIQKKMAGWQPRASSKATSSKHSFYSKLSHTIEQGVPRGELPTPIYYYRGLFHGLQASGAWVNVRCCFHPDKNPSLSLNLKSGGFYCHACGASGGDVIEFHRKHFGLGFKDAVTQLKKIRQEELK